jgi:hypothetical protein
MSERFSTSPFEGQRVCGSQISPPAPGKVSDGSPEKVDDLDLLCGQVQNLHLEGPLEGRVPSERVDELMRALDLCSQDAPQPTRQGVLPRKITQDGPSAKAIPIAVRRVVEGSSGELRFDDLELELGRLDCSVSSQLSAAVPEDGSIDQLMRQLDAMAQMPQKDASLSVLKRELEALVPPRAEKKETHVVFAGDDAIQLTIRPPLSGESGENRCLIAYLVALGIAQLHKLGLCHMNIKAKHVELGKDESSGLWYGRLVDEDSVVPAGGEIRRCTPQYSDPFCAKMVASPANDMWSFGLFFYELIKGRACNPFLRLKEITKDNFPLAIQKIHDTLSKETLADRLIARLLCPAKERLTAQQTVEGLRQCLGDKRCQQLVFQKEVSQVLSRIVRPFSMQFLIPKSCLRTDPVKHRALYSMMHHIASSLARLHTKKLVYMNVRPTYMKVFQDPGTQDLSVRLMYSEGSVPVGQTVRSGGIQYLDFSANLGVTERKAAFEDDCWALGLLMLEVFYGADANLLREIKYNKDHDRIDGEEWKRGVESIRERTRLVAEPINQIIDGLLRPASERMTAERAAKALADILHITTADTLMQAPPSSDELKERFVVAWTLARDFAEKSLSCYLTIAPKYIELMRSEQTGTLTGARFIGELPKVDSYEPPRADPFNRSFGLLLFSFMYGQEAIGIAVDYENLPSRTSPEWSRIIANIEKVLNPEGSRKIIDQSIWLLLTNQDFSVANSVGLLQWCVEGKILI